MKKPTALEQNRLRRVTAGGVGKTKPGDMATANAVKPRGSRKVKTLKPAAFMEKHVRESEVHPVTFEYFNTAAGEVFLAGTFNDWQPRATPMMKQREGSWSTELMLRPGRYEYRLIVDGQWQADPRSARQAPNPFGGLNSVVEVKARGN